MARLKPMKTLDISSDDCRASGIIPGSLVEAICTECASTFTKRARSHKAVCSAECKRLRGLRHGAEFRRHARQLRNEIHARFGDRAPTLAEMADFVADGFGNSNDRRSDD